MRLGEDSNSDVKELRGRYPWVLVLAAIAFIVLIARLWYLQITSSEEYVLASENTYIHKTRLPAPRGLILDSQRKPIATNRLAYNVVVTPAFLPKPKPFLRKIGAILELNDEELQLFDKRAEAAILAAKSVNDLPTVRLKGGLSSDVEQRLLDSGLDHEGVEVRQAASGEREAWFSLRHYPSRMRVLRLLQEFLQIKPERFATIAKHVLAAKGLDMFEEIRVVLDIGQDELHALENNREILPGVKVQQATHRLYPFGDRVAHAVGYTKEMTPPELDKLKEKGYKLGDYIGKIGIERLFEDFLRGQDGEEWVVVNSKGVPQTDEKSRELLPGGDDKRREAVPGNTVVLSLDVELSEAANEAISQYPVAAVVALEPATGFILAMASKPSFDLNRMASRITRDELAEMETNPLKPLISKPLMETYFPGSTFKLFTAISALESKKITAQQRFSCGGSLYFGRRFGCHKRSGHGSAEMIRGLAYSCDVYFYNLGMRIGLDRLQATAHKYGFGEKTGLGFSESEGFIPNKKFYRDQNNGYYPAGQDLNNSIGQGDIKLTMLQLALGYGAVANGGHLMKPQIVRRIESADGRLVKENPPIERRNTGLSKANHKVLIVGLNAVTNAPFGTAYWRRLKEYKVAGKTGTAQRKVNSTKKVWQQTYEERDDAVFVGFSPPDKPEIVAAAIVPHSGHGASVAMPVVNMVIKAYFDLKAARAAAAAAANTPEGGPRTLSASAP